MNLRTRKSIGSGIESLEARELKTGNIEWPICINAETCWLSNEAAETAQFESSSAETETAVTGWTTKWTRG